MTQDYINGYKTAAMGVDPSMDFEQASVQFWAGFAQYHRDQAALAGNDNMDSYDF